MVIYVLECYGKGYFWIMSKKKKRKNKNNNKNEIKELNNDNIQKNETENSSTDVLKENNETSKNATEEKEEKLPSKEEISEKIHEVVHSYDGEDHKEKEIVDKKIKTPLDKKIHDNIMNYENDEKKSESNIVKKDTSDALVENPTEKSKELLVVENKEDEDEKPEYVKEMLSNKKKRTRLLIGSVSVVLVIVIFSTVFAFMRKNSDTIVSKTDVKDIVVSDKTMDEAKNELTDKLNIELSKELEIKYGEDYSITMSPDQIEFSYDIDNAVSKAYDIGRTDNIVKNNYTILKSMILGNNIDIGYSYNEELLNKMVDDLNAGLPGVVVEPSYYIEEAKLIVDKGKDGIQIKKDDLKNLIVENIVDRTVEEVAKDDFKQTVEIPVENAKASKIDMAKIYEEIHTEPKDAYFTTEPYSLFPDSDGIDLATSVEETQKTVDAEDKDEYTFKLKITKASKTIKDLGLEAFPYEISRFSTNYDASNTNRSTNSAIAANKINGTVLMPGEEFSYNKVVGKRTVEEGYKDAKIYADGGVVDGLAGGICQISSTLYNAALLANLEIVERHNHSYPTSYLGVGRDATVVYGVKDLKFKNTRSYPVKIEASVKGGVATFVMHGIKEEKEYSIKLIPVTTGTIGHGTQTVPDPSLPAGQQVVKQSGHAGYRVTTYIEKTCNGETTKEILSNDTYQPMNTIIRVGTAGVPAAAPAPQ